MKKRAIIVGSAPCLFEDLQQVGKGTIFALNDAAAVIHADYLVTLHPANSGVYKSRSKNKNIKALTGQYKPPSQEYEIDKWFDNCNSKGTSAGCAIKIAIAMGFKEIVLCGCPLNAGDGYVQGADYSALPEPQRVGNMPSNSALHQRRLAVLESESLEYPKDVKIYSVSGKTKELFERRVA